MIEKTTSFQAATLAVCLWLFLSFASAEEQSRAVPDPAPTNAVEVSGRTLTVMGSASVEQGVGPARLAALLDAYSSLLLQGLKNELFPGSRQSPERGFQIYRVDSDHPIPGLVSWIARSKVVQEDDRDGERIVKVQSPPVGTVASAEPFLRAMFTSDVDGDGLSDIVGMGYDGRVYLMQRGPDGESEVMARSESFALLELVSGPGLKRIRTVFPQDVSSMEMVGNNQARAFLELETLEVVNGELLGRTTEKREVFIPIDRPQEKIRFNINQPPDFAQMDHSKVEIKGNAISEKLLENVQIRHNGRVAWESPEGIGIRALNFNLTETLEPGWNSLRFTARDKEGYFQLRELWVSGPTESPVRMPVPKKAVIVAMDDKLKDERFLETLAEAGFPAERVVIMEEDEASGERLIQELRESNGAEELLLYCESFAVPGALIEGKTLRFADREVAPSEIAQALEAGGYHKVVGVFHSEIPRAFRGNVTAETRWRDTVTFLDRLGSAGRLVFANVEDLDRGLRSQRKDARKRFLEGLRMQSGSDLERLMDKRQPMETVFRGWMYGSPVSGLQ